MPPSTRSRARLSRERILAVAINLIDTEGEQALTFRRLGRALDADPTAVYRYFRSKDALLLAMTDQLIESGVAETPIDGGWRETMRSMAHLTYQAGMQHPRLMTLVAHRTTQGAAETEAIERVLTGLHDAGFSLEEAVTIWRSFADAMLSFVGMEAAYVTLPEEVKTKDLSAWSQMYLRVDPERYPTLNEAAPYVEIAGPKEHFNDAVELMLDGIAARLETKRLKAERKDRS